MRMYMRARKYSIYIKSLEGVSERIRFQDQKSTRKGDTEKKSHQNISRFYGRNRRKSQRRNNGPIRNRKAEPGRYGRTIRTAKGNF